MKKLSYLFLLLVGIWLAGCDDSSEASLIPEIIPTAGFGYLRDEGL